MSQDILRDHIALEKIFLQCFLSGIILGPQIAVFGTPLLCVMTPFQNRRIVNVAALQQCNDHMSKAFGPKKDRKECAVAFVIVV